MAYICADHAGTDREAPKSYLAWFGWADLKGRTHKQLKCCECGRFRIWVRRLTEQRGRSG